MLNESLSSMISSALMLISIYHCVLTASAPDELCVPVLVAIVCTLVLLHAWQSSHNVHHECLRGSMLWQWTVGPIWTTTAFL